MDATASAEALARDMGAGTMVSGIYYQQGDSLRFEGQITETLTGRLIDAVGPVGGSADDPLEAAEPLKQGIMTAMAARFSPDLAGFAQTVRPPADYEAYREYVTGRELFGRGDPSAMPHLLRALSLDSTFVPAALQAAVLLQVAGQNAQAASIVASLSAARSQLTDVERHLLDYLEAVVQWDLAGAARAARQAYELAPMSPELAWMAGQQALFAGRPREAIDILSGLEGQLDQVNCCYMAMLYWGHFTDAFHVIGEHERELQAARRGRQQFPELLSMLNHELVALAALGRVDEIERLLDESLAFRAESGPSPGQLARGTAGELRAHGYREEARQITDRALDWIRRRTPEEAEQPGNRVLLGLILDQAERFDEARDVFEGLVDEAPDNSVHLLELGLIAAKQGRVEEARAIRSRLADMRAPHLHWQADFAAVLGEKEEAVRYLQDSFGRGVTYGAWLHRDSPLEALRDYPLFQEFIRPKG